MVEGELWGVEPFEERARPGWTTLEVENFSKVKRVLEPLDGERQNAELLVASAGGKDR
jgi:hypothetical protein